MDNMDNMDRYDMLFQEYSAIFQEKVQNEEPFSFYHLLLANNFRGGAETFTEDIQTIEKKLSGYFDIIMLYKLEVLDREDFIKGCFLLSRDEGSAIVGFNGFLLSVLLALSFPNTFPIMYEKVLLNFGIIEENEGVYTYKEETFSDIHTLIKFYGQDVYLELFHKFTQESQEEEISMYLLNKKYFTLGL